MPLSGGKRIVDVEQIRDYLDEIRQNLPVELRQAQSIVSDRAQLIESANAQAQARKSIGIAIGSPWKLPAEIIMSSSGHTVGLSVAEFTSSLTRRSGLSNSAHSFRLFGFLCFRFSKR